MNDSDIVNVELVGYLGETVDAGSGYEVAEKLPVVWNFGRNCGSEALGDLFGVSNVVYSVALHFVEQFESLFGGLFVAYDDLTGVKTHSDEVFCVAE